MRLLRRPYQLLSRMTFVHGSIVCKPAVRLHRCAVHILQSVLGRNPGTLEGIAANIAAGGTLSHYSREAERQADRQGVQYTAAAGYFPHGMLRFLEKMNRLKGSREADVDRFFASHPLTATRISDVKAVVASMPVQNTWRSDDPRFQRLKQILSRY